jgi:hypothetical protein
MFSAIVVKGADLHRLVLLADGTRLYRWRV